MKFRKKPVVIEAFQWTGGADQTEDPVWIIDAIKTGKVSFANAFRPHHPMEDIVMRIKTLEGFMQAEPGDWIIKGVKEEIYPCKPDIFDVTYERDKDEGC